MSLTRTQLLAAVISSFPDNDSEEITPSVLRSQQNNLIAASMLLAASYTTLFVAKNGDDMNGDGSIGTPYLTISKAIAVVTVNADASATKPYVIDIGPGTYTENVEIGKWTHLRGKGNRGLTTTFIDGIISLTDNFTGGAEFSITDLVAANFIDSSSAALSFKCAFSNFHAISNWIMDGRSGSFVWVYNSGCAGFTGWDNFVVNSFSQYMIGSSQFHGCAVSAFGGQFETLSVTSNGGNYHFYGCKIGVYNAAASSTTFFDAVSYPGNGVAGKDPSATYNLFTKAPALSYTPADSSKWNGDPTNAQDAIDRIAAVVGNVTPIP